MYDVGLLKSILNSLIKMIRLFLRKRCGKFRVDDTKIISFARKRIKIRFFVRQVDVKGQYNKYYEGG